MHTSYNMSCVPTLKIRPQGNWEISDKYEEFMDKFMDNHIKFLLRDPWNDLFCLLFPYI